MLRRLSVYALSKIDLDRYRSFRKILLILSWDINLNPGPVYWVQNENLLHVLSFYECSFSRDRFYYNLNSFSENVSQNDRDVFKKRGMYFIHVNIDFCQKLIKCYIANINNASIIGISETEQDKTILSSEFDVDGYDLARLNQSRKGGGVACYI